MSLALAAGAALVALLGLRLVSSPPTRPLATATDAGKTTGQVTMAGRATAAGDSVHDLMMDLLITPLDGPPAKPFALESLAGGRVALSDLKGRPALLYFWATW
ncbi:MAG TPA: hypothetical protein VGV13_19740 [Methylomirabilota bacterium]|jgi:cytochrome oxidase Cu insertion factor (SCO1/SenC/PrrC family)|nr:hypothetical protein [Methylomirabilota bacterium]